MKTLKWVGVALIVVFLALLIANPFIFNPDEEPAAEMVLDKELRK